EIARANNGRSPRERRPMAAVPVSPSYVASRGPLELLDAWFSRAEFRTIQDYAKDKSLSGPQAPPAEVVRTGFCHSCRSSQEGEVMTCLCCAASAQSRPVIRANVPGETAFQRHNRYGFPRSRHRRSLLQG